VELAYRTAFLDWLACAVGGAREPAVLAARRAHPEDLVFGLAAAGHVLDFDDTYAPGLAHCSAPTAPAALVVGAEAGAPMRDVLAAHAAGFEAMAALARASHPELYRRGWHPTAVCGAVGAAVAAATVLGLEADVRDRAARLALLHAGGLLSAFGSVGKPLQVAMASSSGVRAARLAAAGASVPNEVIDGFEAAYGGTWAEPDNAARAIRENWIKAYPCCLQTHSSIEAAAQAREKGVRDGLIRVRVHPLSVQAAPYGIPANRIQAKFSIPYTVAFALLHGPPNVESFRALDDAALRLAPSVEVLTDPGLGQSEAVLQAKDGRVFRVEVALGSPERPMTPEALQRKVRSLAGDGLEELVGDDVRAQRVLGSLWSTSGRAAIPN
jgi:2-methylcitrate dehydratase PrpD